MAILERGFKSSETLNEIMEVVDEREVLGKEFRIYGDFENPKFLAKDVAEWIDYSKTGKGSYDVSRMLGTIDEGEKVTNIIRTLGGNQKAWFLTEDGLYEVLMQSRKPIAKEFKKKVKEILKDVRRHGMYMTESLVKTATDDPDFMIAVFTRYKEEKQKRLKAEGDNRKLMHTGKTYTATEVSKEAGFKSAQAFNSWLKDLKIQYFSNGTWVMYSKYADKGYVEQKQEILDNDKVIYHRRFTQAGRKFILDLVESEKGGGK